MFFFFESASLTYSILFFSGTPVLDALPTVIGLATIPFIVKPLDELAEGLMDSTLRKLWEPYLNSCTVEYD